MVVQQEATVTIDAAKWGLEIVCDGIGEGFQFATFGVEGSSTRGDTLFQFRIEPIK